MPHAHQRTRWCSRTAAAFTHHPSVETDVTQDHDRWRPEAPPYSEAAGRRKPSKLNTHTGPLLWEHIRRLRCGLDMLCASHASQGAFIDFLLK